MNKKIVESYSSAETFEFARNLSMRLPKGSLVCLDGDLGTGKTVFAKGIASGLGIKDDISSPSFNIMNVYEDVEIPLYHFDVYRIEDLSEMYELGYEEYFFSEGICLVEWAGLIKELIPADAIWINIEKDISKGFDYRRIVVGGQCDEDTCSR